MTPARDKRLRILAIDTTEDACSAALLVGDEMRWRYQVAPRQHSQLILQMMDELLVESGIALVGLDALAFCRGPGSFTGIRIATAVVQGAAFAADLPVLPIFSSLALAHRARREHRVTHAAVALDARMNEVYWAPVQVDALGVAQFAGPEMVTAPESVPVPEGNGWVGVGSGWASYTERLRQRLGGRLSGVLPSLRLHAHDVAQLGAVAYAAGQGVSADQALPVYLRDRVAWKKDSVK